MTDPDLDLAPGSDPGPDPETTWAGYVRERRSSGGGEWGECPCRAQFASALQPIDKKIRARGASGV